MSDKKEYVKLWLSYGTYFQSYSPEEVGNLVLAMLAYKDSGKEPDFQGPERFIWPAIRRDMNEARQAQEAAAEQHRACGKKGGRRKTGDEQTQDEEEQENQNGSCETNLGTRTKDNDKDNNKGHRQGQGQAREGTAPLPSGSAGGRRGAAGRRRKNDFGPESPQNVLEDMQRMQRYYQQLNALTAPEETATSPPEPDTEAADQSPHDCPDDS